MENSIERFVHLMEQKGYRDRFRIAAGMHADRLSPPKHLKEHLAMWISVDFKEGRPKRPLFLSYQFYSPLHRENVECRFECRCLPDKDVLVARMRIELGYAIDQKMLQFRNNHEVPGYQSIEGQFKRRNPWDDQARGRLPKF